MATGVAIRRVPITAMFGIQIVMKSRKFILEFKLKERVFPRVNPRKSKVPQNKEPILHNDP